MATTGQNNEGVESMEPKKRPGFKKKYFPVEVAVFEFDKDERLDHSVELTKSFRRRDGSWATTRYLSVSDLLPAAKLLSEAHSFIQGRMQAAYDEGRYGHDLSEQPNGDIPF